MTRLRIKLNRAQKKNKRLEKEKEEMRMILVHKIKTLEKKLRKAKKKSQVIVEDIEGYISNRSDGVESIKYLGNISSTCNLNMLSSPRLRSLSKGKKKKSKKDPMASESVTKLKQVNNILIPGNRSLRRKSQKHKIHIRPL